MKVYDKCPKKPAALVPLQPGVSAKEFVRGLKNGSVFSTEATTYIRVKCSNSGLDGALMLGSNFVSGLPIFYEIEKFSGRKNHYKLHESAYFVRGEAS